MKKLKPCPFCGSGNVSVVEAFEEHKDHIVCSSCKMGIYEINDFEAAFNMWNRREDIASDIDTDIKPEHLAVFKHGYLMAKIKRFDNAQIQAYVNRHEAYKELLLKHMSLKQLWAFDHEINKEHGTE